MGEVPTISFGRLKGRDAVFIRSAVLGGPGGEELYSGAHEGFRTYRIAGREVFRPPGHPGPYGDQAFYFVIPAGDDLLEVLAQKFCFGETDASGNLRASGYDEVVRDILRSLRLSRLSNIDTSAGSRGVGCGAG